MLTFVKVSGIKNGMSDRRLNLRKVLSRKITLMVVPHSAVRPINFQFSFSFILFLIFFWTGLTFWASWAIFSNVDYWTTRINHKILKLKVYYFASELKKSRELVDQVREADLQLRKLLEMKNRQSIIEAEPDTGKGGAESFERSILQKELQKRLWEITDEEIRKVSHMVQKESQVRLQSYKEISEYIAYERGLTRSTPLGWPAFGRATSGFGHRFSPFDGLAQFHTGIDIANEKGTLIRATADGTVQLASWEGGYGRLVIIDHGFGYVTYYGHNSRLLAKVGEKIRRGQVIAYMGSTGATTGPHAHYEVLYNGRPVNPWKYLVARSVEDLRERRKHH